MAPIAKENEILTAGTETAARPNQSPTLANDGPGKPQAVALEVPVSVNGARAVDGSDKREPFSETTKTVLVFGNGAVIRLQSPVAPGQLLFLTNEKTKKEVVCQVVKSKNYRNVSGYVELEFTEPVVGFWGMRFPSDRISSQPTTAGTSPVTPSVGRPAAPSATPNTLNPSAPALPKPDATANFNALKALVSSPADSESPRITETSTVPPAPKAPPALKSTAPAAGDPATEALKLQTARLQEQLSSMLFTEKPSVSAMPEGPAAQKEAPDAAAKILEFVKPDPPRTATPAPSALAENAAPMSATPPVKLIPPAPAATRTSTLESEEVKIPSWLEPLARNAAVAPVEIRTKEEPKPHEEEPLLVSHLAEEPVVDSATPGPDLRTPSFGASFLEPEASSAIGARSSKKGIVIGALAAGLLLAAAGVAWYVRNQGGTTQASATIAPVSTTAALQKPAPSSTSSSLQNPSTSPAGPSVSPGPSAAAAPTVLATPNSVKPSSAAAASASISNAVAKVPQPTPTPSPIQVQVQPPKKPALGQVRLAAPKLRGGGQPVPANGEEPGIALNSAASTPSDALSAGLTTSSKQPVAPAEPLPVGGDVKPAKLLNAVSPVYPSLAKSQHVAGDVKVDALIDANGRVTTMKVVSGPTLLHQAAMDALRQWKYQPATLDGKPVSMHLTVTLQFRLQ